MKKLITLITILFAPVIAFAAQVIPITTTDAVTLVPITIDEGTKFTLGVGGDVDSDSWNSVSIDFQVKINAEWVTVPDFDDVTAAKVIYIEMAPGEEWRFSVTGGTDPALKAYINLAIPAHQR